jgi:HPt (histidine-containing phosphotransfer) domain-containing protein
MNRDDGFEELRTMFAEDLAEKIKALQAALTDSNWESIVKISHQIGGTAKSFGYPEISAAAHELERSSGKISLEEAAVLVKKISELFVL